MITREKQRKNAIKTVCVGITCMVGLTLSLMFVEIHQHQAAFVKQMNDRETLLLKQQAAFETNQREALTKLSQSQQSLMSNWHQAARSITAIENAVRAELIAEKEMDAATTNSVDDSQVVIPTPPSQAKPLSPQK